MVLYHHNDYKALYLRNDTSSNGGHSGEGIADSPCGSHGSELLVHAKTYALADHGPRAQGTLTAEISTPVPWYGRRLSTSRYYSRLLMLVYPAQHQSTYFLHHDVPRM